MAVKPGCFAIWRDQNLSPNQLAVDLGEPSSSLRTVRPWRDVVVAPTDLYRRRPVCPFRYRCKTMSSVVCTFARSYQLQRRWRLSKTRVSLVKMPPSFATKFFFLFGKSKMSKDQRTNGRRSPRGSQKSLFSGSFVFT